MKPLTFFLLVVVLSTGFNALLLAQNAVATQHLTMEVKPVVRLQVSSDPLPLTVQRTTTSDGELSVSDHSTRYALVTNVENMKISASIDRPMPQGTGLSISLQSVGGCSRGEVDLSRAVVPAEVVTGLPRGSMRDESITYTFRANAEVAELQPESRTITLTLTD